MVKMKATLYSITGEKKYQVELPKMFETKVREDIVSKYHEADKLIQPYSAKYRAGLRQAAAGKISHKRHDWKGHYGKGISRISRKTMWRRGTQFMWVGANVPGTRGGRKAHPPLGIGREKKTNQKEIILAFNSAYAATASPTYVANRYFSVDKINDVPKIIESLPTKTKDLLNLIKTLFSENLNVVLRKKSVRAGKGKTRGRKYKSNAGVLIITAPKESKALKGFDIKSTDEISIADLYPLGRITVYTQKALETLGGEKKK
jgi:large subunit ribosomal protein L4e